MVSLSLRGTGQGNRENFACHCERSEAISIPLHGDCRVASCPIVMAGLGPAIHVFLWSHITDVDGRPSPTMTMEQDRGFMQGRPLPTGVELAMTVKPVGD